MQHLIPPLSIVMNLIAGLVLGGYFYFLIAIYVGLAMGFFTVWPDFIKTHTAISNQCSQIRTLRLVLVLESSRVVVEAPVNSTSKNYFLIVIAIFQMLVIYYLGMA